MTDLDRAIELKSDDARALVARAEFKFRGRDEPGTVTDLDAADALMPEQANERFDPGCNICAGRSPRAGDQAI